jgi:hypothetical protein
VRQNASQNIAGVLGLVRRFLRRFGGGTRTPQPDRVPAGVSEPRHATAARRADRADPRRQLHPNRGGASLLHGHAFAELERDLIHHRTMAGSPPQQPASPERRASPESSTRSRCPERRSTGAPTSLPHVVTAAKRLHRLDPVGQAPKRCCCAGSRFGVTGGLLLGFQLFAQDVCMPGMACRLVDHVHVDPA